MPLGASTVFRSKATAKDWPEERPIPILEAARELGPRTFTFWMLVLSLPPDVLTRGQRSIARALGMQLRASNASLKELWRFGYLEYVEVVGGRISILLTKRCAINTRTSGFVSLA